MHCTMTLSYMMNIKYFIIPENSYRETGWTRGGGAGGGGGGGVHCYWGKKNEFVLDEAKAMSIILEIETCSKECFCRCSNKNRHTDEFETYQILSQIDYQRNSLFYFYKI